MSHRLSVVDANTLRAGLQTQAIGRPLHVFDRVASTNDVAKALAEEGAPDGTAVLAEEQTGGRGRFGRRWASPLGGLWLSLVLRPRRPATEWSCLGFAASVAAATAVETVAGLSVRVKWPNDLMLEGRKLGGVLVEASGAYVVVGIGMNVNLQREALPADVRALATSLEERLGHTTDFVALTQEVLREIERFYHLVEDDPHFVMEQWVARSLTVGRPVRVVSTKESFDGVAESVDDQGALLVRTSAGLRRVVASDVSVRELERPQR